MPELYSDATLVIVGHGSTVNAGSAAPVHQHVEELRRRKIFAQVAPALWKEEPFVDAVVNRITAPRVFVVPLLISEGYFSEEAIPEKLGLRQKGQTDFNRVQKRGAQTLYYCRPIGTDESMTNALLGRAKEIVEQFPFPRAPKPKDTSLFIAGHGTTANDNSRKAIDRQVELIAAMNIYNDVHPIFIEEDPRIADCYMLAAKKNIIVVPFFISDGMHTVEDIPEMLGEPKRLVQERLKTGQPTWRNPSEKKGKMVWYTRAVGTEPHIADVILERVLEASKQL
ncbi:MAG: Cobalamin [Verrucomicrobiales bacterium]|nr:Cobalamin [Verrucomicrobiales bacterium]